MHDRRARGWKERLHYLTTGVCNRPRPISVAAPESLIGAHAARHELYRLHAYGCHLTPPASLNVFPSVRILFLILWGVVYLFVQVFSHLVRSFLFCKFICLSWRQFHFCWDSCSFVNSIHFRYTLYFCDDIPLLGLLLAFWGTFLSFGTRSCFVFLFVVVKGKVKLALCFNRAPRHEGVLGVEV
jgi:hypothetical protein